VVSQSEGDVTNFVAGIPLVDPASLVLKVDGVDIAQALGVEPETCTPDAPCSGSVRIGDHDVTISDLAVQSAPSIKIPSSNTVTMTVKELGCGGHGFVLDGERRRGCGMFRYRSSCHRTTCWTAAPRWLRHRNHLPAGR
jgi:phage baseplate assembly protein gpV